MSLLDNVTSLMLNTSLGLAVDRHDYIAHNVANVHTPGFQAIQVQFNQSLAQVKNISADLQFVPQMQSMAFVKQQLESVKLLTTSVGQVDLATQMADLTENTIYYQSLLKAKKDWGSLARIAITGKA